MVEAGAERTTNPKARIGLGVSLEPLAKVHHLLEKECRSALLFLGAGLRRCIGVYLRCFKFFLVSELAPS